MSIEPGLIALIFAVLLSAVLAPVACLIEAVLNGEIKDWWR